MDIKIGACNFYKIYSIDKLLIIILYNIEYRNKNNFINHINIKRR